MDLQRINKHKQSFDDICHYIEDDNGANKVEVWFAAIRILGAKKQQ